MMLQSVGNILITSKEQLSVTIATSLYCDCLIRITGEEKKILIIVSIIGFVFHDGVYVAAVVNYAIQSELNISLLRYICMKVKKRYDMFDAAIKVGVTTISSQCTIAIYSSSHSYNIIICMANFKS